MVGLSLLELLCPTEGGFCPAIDGFLPVNGPKFHQLLGCSSMRELEELSTRAPMTVSKPRKSMLSYSVVRDVGRLGIRMERTRDIFLYQGLAFWPIASILILYYLFTKDHWR